MTKSKNPPKSAVLEAIKEEILLPLFKYKHETETLEDFLSRLFHLEDRSLEKYMSKRRLQMPGVFLEQGCIPTDTPERRLINRGDILLVRRDATRPDMIEISAENWTHNKESVFRLNMFQWHYLRKHLSQPLQGKLKTGPQSKQHNIAVLLEAGLDKHEAAHLLENLGYSSKRCA